MNAIRPRWSDLPTSVRATLEARLNSRLAEVHGVTGGFTPGMASVLRADTGERFFVKATSPRPNPSAPDAYRREAQVAQALPDGLPTPRLLWWGEVEEWTMLVFEYVEGVTPRPTEPSDLHQVLRAVETLARLLTPSPIVAPRLSDGWADDFSSWRNGSLACLTCRVGLETGSLRPCPHSSHLRRFGPRRQKESRCCTGTCAWTTCSSRKAAYR